MCHYLLRCIYTFWMTTNLLKNNKICNRITILTQLEYLNWKKNHIWNCCFAMLIVKCSENWKYLNTVACILDIHIAQWVFTVLTKINMKVTNNVIFTKNKTTTYRSTFYKEQNTTNLFSNENSSNLSEKFQQTIKIPTRR